MNAIRISMILGYIYLVYGKTYLTSFTRQYVQDDYHCNPPDVSFDNLSMNHDVVSCLLHCGHTSGCLSVSYDNVTKRCVGCQSFIDTNNTAGDSSLLVFEKQVCPEGTEIRRDRSCYFSSPLPTDNSQSETFCEERGAHLVQIETDAENKFLKQYFQDRFASDESIWIGMTVSITEGTWTFIDSGQPVTFTDWMYTEQNGNCAISVSPYNWKWYAVPCTGIIFHAVCEHSVED